jgi:hypothetical protein
MARPASTVASILSRAYREANVTALGVSPTASQISEGVDNLNSFMSIALGMDLGEPLSDWLSPAPQRTAPVAANFPQGPQVWNGSLGPGALMGVYGTNVTPYPPINSRVIWGGVTQTVYFPERPENGSRLSLVQGSGLGDAGAPGNVLTLDANGRYIGVPTTPPTVVPTNTFTFSSITPASADWIYVAAYGIWMPIGTLKSTDTFILPPDYDDYFIVGTAGRLAPKYNKVLSAESQAAYMMAQAKVKSEFAQKHDTVYGSWEFPNSLQSYSAGRWLGAGW